MEKKNYITLLLLVLSISGLVAQDGNSSNLPSKDYENEIYQNHNQLALFAGGTTLLEHQGTHFSLGFNYFRAITVSHQFSAGAFAEVIFTQYPEWVFGVLVYYQPVASFMIRTGPGLEIAKHEEVDPECGCIDTKSQTEFLYRIGIGYSFHTKKLILTPTVDVDFVRSATALIFGINIGFAF